MKKSLAGIAVVMFSAVVVHAQQDNAASKPGIVYAIEDNADTTVAANEARLVDANNATIVSREQSASTKLANAGYPVDEQDPAITDQFRTSPPAVKAASAKLLHDGTARPGRYAPCSVYRDSDLKGPPEDQETAKPSAKAKVKAPAAPPASKDAKPVAVASDNAAAGAFDSHSSNSEQREAEKFDEFVAGLSKIGRHNDIHGASTITFMQTPRVP